MEAISLVLFILGLSGYLISEDYIGHLWGASFINTSIIFLLIGLSKSESFKISESEILFIYISLSVLLITGLFVIRGRAKREKIDELVK